MKPPQNFGLRQDDAGSPSAGAPEARPAELDASGAAPGRRGSARGARTRRPFPSAGWRPRSAADDTLDYAAVGLISGLEVHQQLSTDRKLFCQCPAGHYTRTHDGTVLRHMRPTLSELGVYDGTALMEFKTRKHIIYLLNRENTCTYEMDDTPPFLVSQQALDIAIEQCLMLGCDIVDEVHIARKQYLDGSIPTGFQRTAIVGVHGKLPFRGREISVTQVSVEEDSCREVSDRGHLIVWRTDRLGMPLIETVTGPDLRTPDEVEEAILLVGRVCRSTRHVRVGMGASRQDVNVSVRGGRRVEIKGVPQAGWARALVHGEGVRQVNLLRLRDELHRRGFRGGDSIAIETADVTELFAASGSSARAVPSSARDTRVALPVLSAAGWERWAAEARGRSSLELGEGPFRVLAVRLRGLGGTLEWPTQPARTFAHELAGRVRVIAGLDQAPILIADDDWPDALGPDLLERVRSAARCEQGDALCVVWGPERDTRTAADEIRLRYVDATDGVPNETRQPFADGSTDFERILPGPDRMYPDTDSPPTRLRPERIQRLRDALPPRPWVREARYAEVGVPRETRHYLVRRGGADLVDRVAGPDEGAASLRFACFLVGERLRGLRRAGFPVDSIPEARWRELFAAIRERPILRQAWDSIVLAFTTSPETPLNELLSREKLGVPPAGWREEIAARVPELREAAYDRDPGRVLRHALSLLMPGLRGKVEAALATAAIREALLEPSPHPLSPPGTGRGTEETS